MKRMKKIGMAIVIGFLMISAVLGAESGFLLNENNFFIKNYEIAKNTMANDINLFDKSVLSNGGTGEIGVIKKIWDGADWAESATADMGDVVTFNITIVYEPNCGNMATDINVTDILPSSLHYTSGDAVIKHGSNTYYGESGISGQLIFWNLSSTYGIYLTQFTPGYPPVVSIIFDGMWR
jgi:uncharacterized repeat protein (TIGR01451 family)